MNIDKYFFTVPARCGAQVQMILSYLSFEIGAFPWLLYFSANVA